MGKNVHDEGTKQDELYDEIYDLYKLGKMDVDELRKWLSKFPSEYLKHKYNKRQAPKHKSCLSIFISQLKDVWQCNKEKIHTRNKELYNSFTRILKLGKKDTSADTSHVTEVPVKYDGQNQAMKPPLDERTDRDGSEDEVKAGHDIENRTQKLKAVVSASHQDGQSSQNESHSTELISENRGMQEEMMIPVMDENNRSDLNGSEDEIKERHDKNKIQGSKAFESASHQDGTCSRKEIASTELLPIKEGSKKKFEYREIFFRGRNPICEDKGSGHNRLEDGIKEETKSEICVSSNELEDSLLDECQRSNTGGLEDESKEEHKTKSKKSMSSNGLVSASHQDGNSSQNESHNTEVIPKNRGMQEETETASHQDGTCSRKEIASTELLPNKEGEQEKISSFGVELPFGEDKRSGHERLEYKIIEDHETKGEIYVSSIELTTFGMDFLLDESKRSNTDGLEDKSKEQHKTKSKNFMSSNGLNDIQLFKPSGSPSPFVIDQAYKLSVRQTTSVSASNQNGKSSQNESHSTKLLSENRGMQEEIETASHQDGTCSRNEIARTELLLISQRMKEKMMDFLLDESKRSNTDGLEDKSKEQHKTKSKNFMSSNGLNDIQFLKPSGSPSPIVDYQEYELFNRQTTRKTAEEIEELKKNIYLKRIGFLNDDGNSLKQLNEKKSHQSVPWTNTIFSRKTKSGSSLPSPEIRRDTDILPHQEFPKESPLLYNEDNPDDTENCSSSESLTTSFFQLISLIPNDLLASTLDYLDERTYSQTDLVLYEVNPRGRRKCLLFTRFWMVTGDLFSNAISLTAHISNIYYTGMYPTDCRMNLYLPCLIGNYLHEEDEIDDRLPGQLDTQEPINGRSSYLTDCTNPRINL